MPLIELPYFIVPNPQRFNGQVPNHQDINIMDQGSDLNAHVIQAPETGDIHAVGWRTGTVNVGGDTVLSLETVSTSTGRPTGTLLGTDTLATVTLQAGDDDTFFMTELEEPATVTKGDIIAVVLRNPPTTDIPEFAVAGANGSNLGAQAFPYTIAMQNRGATEVDQLDLPCVLLRYGEAGTDATFPQIVGNFPFADFTNDAIAYNDTDYPDEGGMKFLLPYNASLGGVLLTSSYNEAHEIKLYDSGGGVLETISYAADAFLSGRGIAASHLFTQRHTITRNEWYRITVKLTSTGGSPATTNVGEVADREYMEAFEGGANFIWTSRQRDGSWTDENTKRPFIHLLLERIGVHVFTDFQ